MRSQYPGQHSDDALLAQDCIPTSLLKLSADNSTRAVKMFAGVQKYMAESGDAPVGAAKAELVQKLLHQVRSSCASTGNYLRTEATPSSTAWSEQTAASGMLLLGSRRVRQAKLCNILMAEGCCTGHQAAGAAGRALHAAAEAVARQHHGLLRQGAPR